MRTTRSRRKVGIVPAAALALLGAGCASNSSAPKPTATSLVNQTQQADKTAAQAIQNNPNIPPMAKAQILAHQGMAGGAPQPH